MSVRIARQIARTSADELALAWKLEVGVALLVLAIALAVCTVFIQRSFGSPGVLGWVAQAFTMIPFSMATFLFVPWMIRSMLRRIATERAEMSLALAVPEPAIVDVQAKD